MRLRLDRVLIYSRPGAKEIAIKSVELVNKDVIGDLKRPPTPAGRIRAVTASDHFGLKVVLGIEE